MVCSGTVIVYNLVFPVVFLLYLPFFIRKQWRRGGFGEGFWERFGCFSRRKREQLAALEQPVWIHACSVGEVNAALTFLQVWQEREPARQFVLSTTTSTGQQIARRKAPANTVPIYFPLDFWFCVWWTFRRVRPSMLLIFEVEIWPTVITVARHRGIPTALVNGRLSDSSAAGYLRHRWFFAPLLRRLSLFCVQTDEDARRLRAVTGSAVAVEVCNTMKFDQVADREGNDMSAVLNRAFPADGRVVFTAASTHAGEEEVMARTVSALREAHPELCLILVPRHAERAPEAEAALKTAGLAWQRLTEVRAPPPAAASGPVPVLLVDTTGDLMDLLAVSDIVFVGKSFAGNTGGHNIIEPAIFGKAIVHGPHMENFRVVAGLFREARAAVEVDDEEAFSTALTTLLEDPAERERLARASRETVLRNRGAVQRTLDLVTQLHAR